MDFVAESAFISTGGGKKMYTLRLYGTSMYKGMEAKGTRFVQNLSIDKQKAIEKGRELALEKGVPFNDEIDFDLKEIERHHNKIEEEAQKEIADNILQSQQEVDERVRQYEGVDPDTLEGQDLAIYKILTGHNVFVSGPGGVGKSWVIHQVKTGNTLLCAPSGIAAINIGGSTCHSLFGLPTGVVTDDDFKKSLPKSTRDVLKSGNVDRIIIDEVSMVRADMLTLIEHKLRMAMDKQRPWGGVQVVVVGDFYQLPPVIVNNEKSKYYEQGYTSPYAFTSKVWDFETIELNKVYRQDNERQVKMLGHIRKDTELADKALRVIQKEAREFEDENSAIALCTTNKSADEINNYWFNRLKAPWKKEYKAIVDGWNTKYGKTNVDETLVLKPGAKVVLCANDPAGQYKNGERGTVTHLKPTYIYVAKENGETVIVERYTWEQKIYVNRDGVIQQEVVGTFKQFPIKLGYAITVHRSQGLTLDAAVIDVGNGCFVHGQLYVALSRVKDLEKLSFKTHVQPTNIIVDDEVKEFYGVD